MLKRDTVFVDIETTGGHVNHDRITELAILHMRAGELVSEWQTLVNPRRPIPESIQRLTGIDEEMARASPPFAAIGHEVFRRLSGKVFVAHNARFDYGFLKNELKRCGRRFQAPVLCTLKLSRRLFPEYKRHNLDSIIRRHGLSCRARHRAAGDARVLFDFLRVIYADLNGQRVDAVIAGLLKRPSLPAALDEAEIDRLPEAPGVYRFYDRRGGLLYVGKSVNIRARVLSHFAADHQGAKEMKLSRDTASIDYIETAGELGALLREARLIKQALPIYNRRLRRHDSLATIGWQPEAMPAGPEIITAELIDPAKITNHFGLFKTKKKAEDKLRELAKAHGLCHKLIGLETGPGACFARQLKRCRGACVGRESPLQHQFRLLRALCPLRNRAWPYAGRIGIREVAKDQGRAEIHLFQNWCYLGTAHDEAELDQLNLFQDNALMFDLDTYRILLRFFKKRPDIIQLG